MSFEYRMYELMDYCMESYSDEETTVATSKDSNIGVVSCADMQWSSFSADPKSTISGIDPVTGLLLP